MRYRALGTSGLVVSVVGLGCNNFGTRLQQEHADQVVAAALDSGITLFDTAEIYGAGASERMLGKALESRRSDVLVSTKFGSPPEMSDAPKWMARGSRSYIRHAVEGSLRRLGTDWIDLYQMHAPDMVTPISETLSTLNDLVAEGKIRYFGCSNFYAWELIDAHWTAAKLNMQGFISTQNEYSLYNRTAEEELVPACENSGIGLLPYLPLAHGLLTGKYARNTRAPEGSRLSAQTHGDHLEHAEFDRIETLEKYAETRGLKLLDVAVGGLAAQAAVGSVISGASTPKQVLANVAAGRWQPEADDLKALAEINRQSAPGMSYSTFRS